MEEPWSKSNRFITSHIHQLTCIDILGSKSTPSDFVDCREWRRIGTTVHRTIVNTSLSQQHGRKKCKSIVTTLSCNAETNLVMIYQTGSQWQPWHFSTTLRGMSRRAMRRKACLTAVSSLSIVARSCHRLWKYLQEFRHVHFIARMSMDFKIRACLHSTFMSGLPSSSAWDLAVVSTD